jgi:hypothetical protein
MHRGNSGGKLFGFNQTTHIHLMFLHEANNLMLLHGIIEPLDIPAVYNHHEIAGEGEITGGCFLS